MNNKTKIITCKHCVMDNLANPLFLDVNGVCQYCREFENNSKKHLRDYLAYGFENICADIKKNNQSTEYDCILGLSGGIDSSYLALKLHDAGLKPLVLHVDAGWNSELAVKNIEKICKYCNFDLHSIVVPWPTVRDLQVAFLKSGVSNIDAVQDHAFFAGLYKYAIKYKIRSVVSGGNIATEGILPKEWHHSAMDASHIRSIAKHFGVKIDDRYPMVGFLSYFLFYKYIAKMTVFRPLNYINYNKVEAIEELSNRVGYQQYLGKHGESRFTTFFQDFYLPERFKIDKRKAHLSSLINSGQMSRADALALLKEANVISRSEKNFVLNKLRISDEEFCKIMGQPIKKATDYKTWNKKYAFLTFIRNTVEKITGRRIRGYF